MTAIANLVHQTTTSTGTGPLDLVAVGSEKTFVEAFGLNSTPSGVYYFAWNRDKPNEREVGKGHVNGSGQLVRDEVIESSNSDTFVNFSDGTKDVTNALPADHLVSIEKLNETSFSVFDYIPESEHAAINAKTSTTDVSSYINQAIEDLYDAGGGYLWFPRGRYIVGDTIIARQGVVCRAKFSTVRIRLADSADCNITDSYDFDAMYAAQDYDTADRADFTQDYGWDGFIFDGNWSNQSTSTLLYGVRMYGRRPTLKNTIICNVAGVGLHTALFGTFNGSYDDTKTKSPAGIDQLEIINCLDEHWIYEGPSDISIGTVVTGVCGDPDNNGDTPQTSRFNSGEPVHSVYWNAWGEAQYMNLNGAKFGHLLYVTSGQRCNIDNLIVAGGWGGVYSESGAFGVIDKLLAQAINRGWSATAKPYVEVATDDLIFNAVTIRRVNGQDNGGYGIKDSGGCQWGLVRNRQSITEGGTFFYADATGISIALLDAKGAAKALHTTSNCDRIDVTCTFNGCTLIWDNDKSGLVGNFDFSGTVGTGNTFESGVTSGTPVDAASLAKGRFQFLDGSGNLQTGLPALGLHAINTSDSSNVQVAILEGDRANPANNDTAYASYRLSDAVGTQTEVVRFAWQLFDTADGTEDGTAIWSVIINGSLTQKLQLVGSILRPVANDGLSLGDAGRSFSDLFGASGWTLNLANGDWLATHSTGVLTVGTGDLRVTTAGTDVASVVTVAGTQTLTNKTIDGGAVTAASVGLAGTFKNTTDANNVQVLRLEGDRGAPANNDTAYASMYLSDGAGNQTEAARQAWQLFDVTDGTEDGSLIWSIIINGSLQQRLQLVGSFLRPITNDTLALGDGTRGISDLFLAAGGEIRLANIQLLDTAGGLSTQTAAATAIAAIGNAINTANKRAGKMVWDTTNNRLMVATGSAAADPWYIADGSASVTPS